MKKNPKIRIFSTFYLSHILSFVSAGVMLFCICFAAGTIVSDNISPDFLSGVIALGTKTKPNSTQSIAETMLHLSMPSVSLTKTAPVTESLTAPTETATEAAVAEPLVQSITYQSAVEEGYKSVNGIYLNNQSGKSVNIETLLNKKLDLNLSDEPSVLIVHTHTTESYTPSPAYNYTPTDTDRTQDENFNMIAVGDIIYEKLKAKGVNVIHDKTVNDYPSYSKSYSKSLKLVKSYTEKYPSIKIVIDVHRDAIVSKDGSKVRPIASFDPSSSQVMLVIGTNASGLDHPNWETNLAFALKLQHQMNELFPTLARPVNLRKERFNQHTAPYSFILEVGSNGNTLDEAKKGAEYFSEALLSLLKL